MKNWIHLLTGVCLLIVVGCSKKDATRTLTDDDLRTVMVVAAACGECQFEMEGDGCDLAVRIDGESYFVDGTSIDEHGDAHASDGFCNVIRNARVEGEVRDGKFYATSFELVDEEASTGIQEATVPGDSRLESEPTAKNESS